MNEMKLQEQQEALATGNYVIHVANARAMVARFDSRLKLHTAANWEELECDAIKAVMAQGGGINISGLYQCPKTLAERAVWSI
jgi:hypothetical protein